MDLQSAGLGVSTCYEAMAAGMCLEDDGDKGGTGVVYMCPVTCGVCGIFQAPQISSIYLMSLPHRLCFSK